MITRPFTCHRYAHCDLKLQQLKYKLTIFLSFFLFSLRNKSEIVLGQKEIGDGGVMSLVLKHLLPVVVMHLMMISSFLILERQHWARLESNSKSNAVNMTFVKFASFFKKKKNKNRKEQADYFKLFRTRSKSTS